MCKRIIHLAVLSSLLLIAAQAAYAAPELVGAPKCKACHRAKTGDQWQIWAESAHARAFETLASVESARIAADMGLGDPRKEIACLRCHATLASLGEGVVVNENAGYSDDEGVGCEACHGPGSDYKARKIMLDPVAARAAGLVMDASVDGCTNCHNADSPTFAGFDFEARWAEIAHPVPGGAQAVADPSATPQAEPAVETLQEILFESSVGDVIFPHDLHVSDAGMECGECHHEIHAAVLDTPHPDYLTSSWIHCETCHAPGAQDNQRIYQCAECHHSELENIADETLSAKVVVHKSCWKCHETGIGAAASNGCGSCHVKAGDQARAMAEQGDTDG